MKNEKLMNVLVECFSLYSKTLCYHWNVTGPNFIQLHEFFEKSYLDLFQAVDDIAERIRTLGEKVPVSFTLYKQKSQMSDNDENANSSDMIKDLKKGNEIVIENLKEAISYSESQDDAGTADMLTERLEIHQKNVWFLNSLLGN